MLVQPDIPGDVEPLVILATGLVLVTLPVYSVYNDAKKRDETATLWAVATLLGDFVGSIFGALLVVVLYLIVGRD